MKKSIYLNWMMAAALVCSLEALGQSTFAPQDPLEPVSLATRGLKSHAAEASHTALLPVTDVSEDANLKWHADIDVATAETQREDASLTKLSDGSFVATYTSGAQNKIYRGMVRKISNSGDTQWETVLQPGICSIADCSMETADGSIIIAGTTVIDGYRRIFVSLVNGDGSIKSTKIFDENYAGGFTLKIIPWNGKYVACSYMTSTDGYTDNVFTVFDAGLSASQYIRKEANTEMRDAYLIGDYVLATSFEQIMAVNLTDPNSFSTLSGNFDRSVQLGETICIPSNNGNNTAISMNCFTMEDGQIVNKWSTSLSKEGISWKQFVNYTYAINGSVYLINKDGYKINIVKFDADGNADVIGENVLNASQYFDDYDFIYGFGVSSDGSMHLLGMSEWKVYVANFDASCNLTSECRIVPDSKYSWAYTLYNQSTFDNDRFDICGYMLLKNADSEFTTYFAEIAPENISNPTVWCSVATMGKVTNIFPVSASSDTDDNLYVSAQSGNLSYLLKYANDGSLSWISQAIPFAGDKLSISNVAVLANGNIAVYGVTENQTTWKYENFVACFNPQGEILWSKQFGDDNVCMNVLAVGMAVDNSTVRIFYNGYLNNDGGLTGLAMTAMDYDGSIIMTKTMPIEGYRFRVAFVKALTDNQLIAGGYVFTDDNIYRPAAVCFNTEGIILSKSISDKYENDCGYTYSDAALSSDGNIFLAGMSYNSTPSKGIFAIIDAEGSFILQSDAVSNCYFRSCAAYDKTGLIFGSFEDAAIGQIKGCVISLTSEGDINWNHDFAIDDYDTYFLFGYGNDKQISVAGFTEDYYTSVLTETLLAISPDGNDISSTPSCKINNSGNNYEMTKSLASENLLFTLSQYTMPVDDSLKMGSINCFNSVNGFSSVDGVINESEISIENGIITVAGPQAHLAIYDLGGRMLVHAVGNRLDASSLDKGIYI